MDGQKEVSIKATNIPFRCVVCNGFGSLKHGSKICQACEGAGYIIVPQDGEIDENEDNSH